MHLLPEEKYLLKALAVFSRRTVIVSPDLTILAAPPPAVEPGSPSPFGRKCHLVFFDRESPCEDCGVRETLRTGRSTVRNVIMDQGGVRKAFNRHTLPIMEDGVLEAAAVLDLEPEYFSGLNQEITGANAFLNNLIQSSVDGIIAADLSGRMLIFNEAAARMTGYDREQAARSLNIRDLYPDGGAREVMRQLRSETPDGRGKLKSFPTDLLCQDGSLLPISLSAAIVYECGRETATVGFFYDLREKERMERELRQAQFQLLQAEKMSSLGKLSAGVAHQLNNPLASIELYSHLLLEDYNLPDRAKEDVRRIIDDTERCQAIVQELLDFARQSSLEVRPHDLNRALGRTIFLLENQPLFQNIEIVRIFDPDLPQVPADLRQLNHVFMNIILNAADAMNGRGVLTVKTAGAKDRNVVRVEISDTGPGIPGEVLNHIFEPFFTTKEEGKGTGLGLSVAYGVIENHRGRITACSAPGQGATFAIELPAATENGDRENTP